VTPTNPDRLVPPDVRHAVDAVNPVPPPRPGEPIDLRARADLARILAAPPETAVPPGWTRATRLGVAAGLAVVLALAAAVLGTGVFRDTGSAYAATPPPLTYTPDGRDAAGTLRRIAARAAQAPDTTGDGRYAYRETRGWNLFTEVHDGERVTSEVVESHTRTWTAPDGSGHTVRTYQPPGEPRWSDESTPGPSALMWPLGSLSADDATLARQLERGHPVENGPAERLVAIGDAYGAMPIPPAVRAAVLRYLADTPGLTLTGRVTDRAGREGLAVSVDSDYSGLPTRYTFIIDPRDGRLLGSEDTLTTSAGKLNVPVPSVIGYTVFLDSRYVDSIEP
jgi:hypothetical protein